ncbi:MAG: hypothetical protein WBB27_15685 [Maribacter sp.]
MRENITFIKDCFTPAEAADVLLSLINDKIKFHSVKSLNLRHEDDDCSIITKDRINRLKDANKSVGN